MDDLIAKLEAAREGSRELDAEIYRATTKDLTAAQHVAAYREQYGREPSDAFVGVFLNADAFAIANPPHYTTSLDAALTLVPEGWHVPMLNQQAGGTWFCALHNNATAQQVHSVSNVAANILGRAEYNPTPELALCIAALKARNADKLT